MSIWKRLFGLIPPKRDADVPFAPSEPPPKFPFELIEVRGKSAREAWSRLRTEGAGKFHPVILGNRQDVESFEDNFDNDDNNARVAEILETAAALDPEQLLERRKEEDPELYSNVDFGKWPLLPRRSSNDITVDKDILTMRHKDTVFIAKIPTANSYEVPAYLQYGGWNACPAPEEHVALMRRWHSLYGAEIIGMTHDVIECTVAKPPLDKEGAVQLAGEQFAYCDDIVTQGCGTILDLAATLLKSEYWYFWWD